MGAITTIDLRWNDIDKYEIVNILKALERLCSLENRTGITINFTGQKPADGLNFNTDFRLNITGETDFAPNWEFNTDGSQNTDGRYHPMNNLEVNDLIQRLVDPILYGCTLSGIKHSNVPDVPVLAADERSHFSAISAHM